MAKSKVFELAKELSEQTSTEIKSKDVVNYLNEKGFDVKNHMSVIEDDAIEAVKSKFGKAPEKAAKPADEGTAAPSARPAQQTPAQRPAAAAGQPVQGQRPAGPNGQPMRPVGPNGQPMQGQRPLGPNGQPMRPVGPNGQPMQGRPQGQRPVGPNGQPMRPVGPNGQPMQGRPQGQRPVGPNGQPMRPVGPNGQPMQGRPQGQRPVGPNGQPMRPVGPNGQPMRPVGPNGQPMRPVGPNGQPMRPVGPNGQPMPGQRPMGQRPVGQSGQPVPGSRPMGQRPAGPNGQPVPGQRPVGQSAGRPVPSDRKPVPEKKNIPAPEVKPAEAPAQEKAPETPAPEVKAAEPAPEPVRNIGPTGERIDMNVFKKPVREPRSNDDGRRGGDRQGERRPYGDRNQGERRSYGDRNGNNDRQGERRSFGDRNQGDRPSYGDRNNQYAGRGGQGRGGQGGMPQDKDADDNRRPAFKRTPDPKKGSSIKQDFANAINKDNRANSISDKRDKKRRYDMDDEDFRGRNAKKDPNRKGAFIKPEVVAKPAEDPDEIKTIIVPDVITLKEFADLVKQQPAAIIKKLLLQGKMMTLNSELSFEEAEALALEYNCICEKEVKVNMVEELLKDIEEEESLLKKRPPVVCVMGHVDHGKTSLLDAIRNTNVTAKESGGITQHIGAYTVEINGETITFLDTPGHEAFTAMRMRGAKSTDIAILVVAADDGVMPQTVEAINHAKAAGVQIIVAINKIDKPGANIDRVKQELTEYELVAEDWGGSTVMVPVSAKSGEGLENLLEMILLTAEVCELKANPDRKARGIVIEAQLDKGRGPVATILVQKGTLSVGEVVAIGSTHGKVRAMIDDKGRRVQKATPSMPVEILGLDGVPSAGEIVLAVADDKEAHTINEAFINQEKERLLADTKAKLSLDGLFMQIQAGNIKELNLIIKADVQGSVEAVKQSLMKLSNEEVVVRVIHGGVGNINESDVSLASASNAIIIGFNVKPDNQAKDSAAREQVEIKLYKVIYNAIEDVEAAMKGMLKPVYEEKVIGHAEIRMIFKSSATGNIAGSYVLDGNVTRGCSCRITRDGEQIFEGALASLKRFKDDVKEVAKGYECGLVFEKFSDIQELDQVEFYVMQEVPR